MKRLIAVRRPPEILNRRPPAGNPKSQIPNPKQITNSKFQTTAGGPAEILNLKFQIPNKLQITNPKFQSSALTSREF